MLGVRGLLLLTMRVVQVGVQQGKRLQCCVLEVVRELWLMKRVVVVGVQQGARCVQRPVLGVLRVWWLMMMMAVVGVQRGKHPPRRVLPPRCHYARHRYRYHYRGSPRHLPATCHAVGPHCAVAPLLLCAAVVLAAGQGLTAPVAGLHPLQAPHLPGDPPLHPHQGWCRLPLAPHSLILYLGPPHCHPCDSQDLPPGPH